MTLLLPDIQHRDLIARELTLRAQSVNEEERSFEAVVSTETPAMVFDFRSYELVEEVLIAAGGEFPRSIPLLDSHSRHTVDNILGEARDFTLQDGKWIGRGYLDDDGETATRAFRKIKQGFLRAVSIGYQVDKYRDIPAGQEATISGRTFRAKERTLRVSLKWRVHELSLVPIGADAKALIRQHSGNSAQPRRSFFR